MIKLALSTVLAALAAVPVAARADATRDVVAAASGVAVAKVHAVGAQVYECKSDGRGGLAWSFREPVATLMRDGLTVGRHFAGPTWEMADGSSVVGKVVDKAPGETADDIPWLKLAVTEHGGAGALAGVTLVQRVATVGGTGPARARPRVGSRRSPMRPIMCSRGDGSAARGVSGRNHGPPGLSAAPRRGKNAGRRRTLHPRTR